MMITFLLPSKDYDPTEAAVVWQALSKSNIDVRFATPDGQVAYADERLVTTGFGLLSPMLMTKPDALQSYQSMCSSEAFQNPLAYENVNLEVSDGLFIPGGHAKGVTSLLESATAQKIVVAAFQMDLPVGCVCHGVLLLARSIDAKTGKSVLYGRETTALVRTMELGAWALTWLWLRDYYRTYDVSVEAEIKQALASPKDFKIGPLLPLRDNAKNLSAGFTVRDGNYISARWPGDCYKLAHDFVNMVKEYGGVSPIV